MRKSHGASPAGLPAMAAGLVFTHTGMTELVAAEAYRECVASIEERRSVLPVHARQLIRFVLIDRDRLARSFLFRWSVVVG